MSDPQQALATQLANIQRRTGRSLDELTRLVRDSGLAKHGEIRAMLQRELGLGYGDANTLAHVARQQGEGRSAGGAAAAGAAAAGAAATPVDAAAAADALYVGPKAALRPIHDRVMALAEALGPFEVAPKKTYLSLRRKRQFAMVGPATNTRVEVGLAAKGLPPSDRLVEMPPKAMCAYTVRLTDADAVDDELAGWLRAAYESAG